MQFTSVELEEKKCATAPVPFVEMQQQQMSLCGGAGKEQIS
jgi:hypothetical protein